MVRALPAATRLQVYFGRCAVFGEKLTRQNIVQAPTDIAFYCPGRSVIKKAVQTFSGMLLTHYIVEAKRPAASECRADVRVVTNVVLIQVGVVDVKGFGGDVQISNPHKKVLRFELPLEEPLKAIEPLELVSVHLVSDFAALRHVGIHEMESPENCVSESCVIAGRLIKAELDEVRPNARNQCHAVVAFLPAEDRVESSLSESFQWEFFISDLRFLERQHIRPIAFEPVENNVQS